MHKKSIRNVVLTFIYMILFGATATFCQSIERDLDKKIDSFAYEGQGLQHAFSLLSITHEIPIGLELKRNAEGKKPPRLSFELKNTSVREILNYILAQYPDYEMKVIDNVVNILPINNSDRMLDLIIYQYSFTGNSKYLLRKSFEDVPELKIELKRTNSSFMTLQVYPAYKTELANDFSITKSNVSLRSLLNSIIIENKKEHFWVFGRAGENNEFVVINF